MWRTMMGFIHVAVAVLSLLSVGQSAPVTSCESLTRHIEIGGGEQLLGKWMFIAESTDITGARVLTKKFVESAWGRITAANESNAFSTFQAQKMFGRCYTLRTEMTLENNTFYQEKPVIASEVLLNTGCPDCLVGYSKYIIGKSTFTGLQLMSRRRKLTAAEMQEFMKQVGCLGLPPPTVLDPEKDLCPEESSSQDTESTDLTDYMDGVGSEFMNLLDRILVEGQIDALINAISSSLTGIKES